ncbi:MAG TPA: hypothetical protein VFD70_12405 [Anaerolineae bacterium]|nr:hypothetical protein [Anaerolineae bacterium]
MGLREWERPGPFTGRGPQGYRRSDERIREEACDRLTQHGQVDATTHFKKGIGLFSCREISLNKPILSWTKGFLK